MLYIISPVCAPGCVQHEPIYVTLCESVHVASVIDVYFPLKTIKSFICFSADVYLSAIDMK